MDFHMNNLGCVLSCLLASPEKQKPTADSTATNRLFCCVFGDNSLRKLCEQIVIARLRCLPQCLHRGKPNYHYFNERFFRRIIWRVGQMSSLISDLQRAQLWTVSNHSLSYCDRRS
jgi:hypothetical protein